MNPIRRVARWMFVSAPGVGVLVISIGIGAGYAATKGGEESKSAPEGPRGDVTMAVPFGAGGEDLSDADRQSLEKFHECIRDEAGLPAPPAPGERPDPDQLPDPEEMRQKMDQAFDKCKSELSDELRQEFEENQQQMEEFRSCMEEQGVETPSPDSEPNEQDREAHEKAFEACRDKLPEGGAGCAGIAFGPGPGGPGGHGGPGFGPPGPPPGGERGTFEFHAPPPSGQSPDTSRG